MKNLSPALLQRIDALDGCHGRWIVDCRAIDGDYSYSLRSLRDYWPTVDGGYYCKASAAEGRDWRSDSPEAAALYCASTGWRSRLLWCATTLDADCSWPGGYEAPAINVANNRVFKDEFSLELELADGDADGLSLDVRFITPEMIETIQSLESYPCLSDDELSTVEMERQDEAWESWAAADWRRAVEARVAEHAPSGVDARDWTEAALDVATDEQLAELFRACAEQANQYWEEESGYGQWIDVDRIAKALDLDDLCSLTGLPLLPADQEWRREAYPWPNAEPAPLVPALPCLGA